MINDSALRAVTSSTFGPQGSFRRPLYDSYCFSRLPATLEFLLTGEESLLPSALPRDTLGPWGRRWQRVVLLLVDGFGWELFQRYAPRIPFLSRLLDQGRVSPITSQFPSTTAAHMTTLHTGLPPSQSGVWEWYYHEPLADAVIAPLLYSLAGDRDRETLKARGLDPEALFPGPRWYRHLAQRGIPTTVFQDEKYADSTYSTTMFDGAKRRGYGSVHWGLTLLRDALLSEPEQRYFFFYIDGIDGRSHSHGLGSPEFEQQVEGTFRQLEELLWRATAGRVSDTLLIMSADHGQVPVEEHPPVYINIQLPQLPSLLKANQAGEPLRFAGSGRDLFLYVQDDRLDDAERMLRELLAGQAEVWRTEPMLAEGLFGPGPNQRLRERLGNLVILPRPGRAVFWFEEGRFQMKHKGSHGGLSPQEMDTGVYLLPL